MIRVQDVPEPPVLIAPGKLGTWAETHLELAEEHERKFNEIRTSLKPDGLDALITKMDQEVEAVSRNVCAAVLFAALEVEATLNFHGVVLLGNTYFDENLERRTPEQKLAGIVAITTQQLVEGKDEINRVLTEVFAARNRVAHPKTKVYKDWKSVRSNEETLQTARRSISNMKRFLELFRQLVPSTFHSNLRDDDPE